MLFSRHKTKMVTPTEALAGRERSAFSVPERHGVLLGNGERRLLPAGKSLGGLDHLGLVATKEHSLTSSPLSSLAQASLRSSTVHLCLLALDCLMRLSDRVPCVNRHNWRG